MVLVSLTLLVTASQPLSVEIEVHRKFLWVLLQQPGHRERSKSFSSLAVCLRSSSMLVRHQRIFILITSAAYESKDKTGTWNMAVGCSCSSLCHLPRIILISQASPKRSPWPFPPSCEFVIHSVHVHCTPVSSCAPVTAVVNSAAAAQGAKENNAFVFGNSQNFKSFVYRDFVLTV